MRWSIVLAVIGLSITDVASFAQSKPDGEIPSKARPESRVPSLFSEAEMVRFHLIQGRICLNSRQHRKGTRSRDEPGLCESITVTSEQGIPSLHYVFQSAGHRVTLHIQHAVHVRIESHREATGEHSEMEQPAFGQVKWSRSGPGRSLQVEGATLLHLWQQDPHGFDHDFGLLISSLFPDSSFETLAHDTNSALLAEAYRRGKPTLAEIEAAVESLSAPRVAQRLVAHRQLLQWGTPVLPVLHTLPKDRLSVEQRARLRDVRLRLRTCQNDTPASLAKLLVNDKEYWQLIALQLNDQQVEAVDRHLVHIGLEPLRPFARSGSQVAVNSERNWK